MKITRHNIATVLEKMPPGKPFLWFRVKLYFRLIHQINKNHVSYLTGVRLLAPRTIGAILIVAIVMTSGATTLYAYHSPNVTRESALYPLKAGVEQLEQTFAFSPRQKAKVLSKLATRRAKEAEFLAEKSGLVDVTLIHEMIDKNTQASDYAKNVISKPEQDNLKSEISSSNREQRVSLEKIKEAGINKQKDIVEPGKEVLSVDNKNVIFLSAPVEMDNLSTFDNMRLKDNAEKYGLTHYDNEKVVISGFLPEDDDMLTEDEVIESSSELKLVKETLEKSENNSNKEDSDNTGDETFIN